MTEGAANQPQMGEALDWRGTDRFQVVRFIGRGGMGAVYEAHDRERQQRVAVKTMATFAPAVLYQFKQEFRALADVYHPNLVRLYEFFADETDRMFFSMELVRGVDFLSHVQKVGTQRAIDGPSGITSREILQGKRPVESGKRRAAAGTSTPAEMDRLRAALLQLVEGVQALHSKGKLHRDIKPSNILVTPEGRVVILDFGVATDIPRAAEDSAREEGEVVGTARYMAPEQALDDARSPSADWYSVGVVLYEALVGAPPFGGPFVEVLNLKASIDPPRPAELVEGVPPDLDALCMALLDRDPAKRPTSSDLLQSFGAAHPSNRAPATGKTPGDALVGREPELAALEQAFELARSGETVAAFLKGRPGMGKSRLLQHFLDGLADRNAAVVLRGRAYERETMPYKAVDAVIDALSRHLLSISDEGGTAVLPPGLSALAHVFPVLRRVPTIKDLPEPTAADPGQLRRRAHHGLRNVLTSLSMRRPLVIAIDDVQWGDSDSVTLLVELLRPPHAPPLLLLMAHLEEEDTGPDEAAFLSEMKARLPPVVAQRVVSVGPLAMEAAQRLSLSILGSDDAAARTIADAAARESGGNPFVLEELTRSWLAQGKDGVHAKLTLEAIIRERLAKLPPEARRMAEVVAVAGCPVPLSTVSAAEQTESPENVLALLSERRFVRMGLRDGREVVEPIHDRVRDTVVGLLDPAALRTYHAHLARVLEATPNADPEAVSTHLLGAGETARGVEFARKAAEAAVKVLAFDQAARLLRLVIETSQGENAAALHARLAEVLAWAGRNAESGRAYIAAAEAEQGAARTAFERAASAQLLAAGLIDEGGQMLHRVLASAGVKTPKSPVAMALSLFAHKARLRVRGLAFRPRASQDISKEDTARLDAMHVAALGLASVDLVLAHVMQVAQLADSLRVGDRARIVRAAILYSGSTLAGRGGPVSAHEREVNRLIERLVQEGGSVVERAFSRGTHGVGLFLRGRWRESVEILDSAYVDVPSQMASVQAQALLYAVYAQAFLGDLVELRRRQQRLLADAEDRGDLFMSVLLRVSHPIVLFLADDDADAARAQVREAQALWSHEKFLVQNWQVMRSETEIELYAGNGVAAHKRLERDQQALDKSHLMNLQYLRALTFFGRGRASVACADGASHEGAKHLADARGLARQLRREQVAWIDSLAALVSASVRNVEGDRDGATADLREAAASADAADMALYAASARYQLGLHLGGTVGAGLLRDAEAVMRRQGIREPARFAAMLAPGTWRPGAQR